VRSIAQSDVRVGLIEGEPGAGKKRLARFLHSCHRNPDASFFVVHSGARHEVEAGTEGTSLWETSDAATIFLEDAEKMPPRQQNELLRRIEDSSLRDVCVVAATCRGLDQAVGQGIFAGAVLSFQRHLGPDSSLARLAPGHSAPGRVFH
jgi:two-component system, NtrC family, nitrogen regulation response regulator NtrX